MSHLHTHNLSSPSHIYALAPSIVVGGVYSDMITVVDLSSWLSTWTYMYPVFK